ncbi:NADP-dependent oxidoreductase [Catenuloplanes atrovinosus]|uniref:NADPH:quinone reductase-like Zn-dependent oxidoreductase n=1 Tax=Catenuloplanes atrovinosus TaxID=137266 RepID=A0AAE3YLG2_9ACTN|nr:NADP-dependent oxidoreductase [Catenuloplanes atrovinosus]MDR7274398.1 NADPH:quinone reductase-like Zn-dependent oxidoreductase [Catenuloplanes atrovinosus]
MRAITFSEYGGPEVLTLSEMPVPEPGPGQVRVAVRAAGVNPSDWKFRSGMLRDLVPLTFPHVPGLELAGVVDATGPDVDLRPGDEVFGWAATGAYAEYALAGPVARKPAALSWADAASLSIAAAAALRDLPLLRVAPGETLLIHGAGGTTGRFAAQVALARGVTVVGTAGARHHDELRALGVVPVEYGDGWIDRVRAVTPAGVDAVYDASGYGMLPGSIALRGTTDRIITIADLGAAEFGVPFSTGGDQTREMLEELARWVTDRGVRILHRRGYPLAEAAAAHAESERGHPHGRLTIEIG